MNDLVYCCESIDKCQCFGCSRTDYYDYYSDWCDSFRDDYGKDAEVIAIYCPVESFGWQLIEDDFFRWVFDNYMCDWIQLEPNHMIYFDGQEFAKDVLNEGLLYTYDTVYIGGHEHYTLINPNLE